jgi:kinesin family member 2/24
LKIAVCVRKRPIFTKEESAGEIDAVSAANPLVRVHECKHKVDGITKVVENHDFYFDNAYSNQDSTDSVYHTTLKPVLPLVFQRNGVVTCFAYGQTGSGKTHTMKGCNEQAIGELFR